MPLFIAMTSDHGEIGGLQVVRHDDGHVRGYRFILDADEVPRIVGSDRILQVLEGRDVREIVARDALARGGHDVQRQIFLASKSIPDNVRRIVPDAPGEAPK